MKQFGVAGSLPAEIVSKMPFKPNSRRFSGSSIRSASALVCVCSRWWSVVQTVEKPLRVNSSIMALWFASSGMIFREDAQCLERIKVFIGHCLNPDLCPPARDHFNMVSPIARKIGARQCLLCRLEPFQTTISSGHLSCPNPQQATATVNLRGEIKARLTGHHTQYGPGQRGMLGVVVCGNTLFFEIDIEVQSIAARASPSFDVGQGLCHATNFGKFLICYADPGCVPGDTVKVKTNPT